ncbi:hypothetical protein HYPSUDRAFT_35816 [Hypholoma sublateritium FD-334 SS-4]|uniref:Uncharacterized protein n=1 Tax=Hypholoma sublateritium (strain FD-334 SS-4) TaxID=945553 RepID=A0A0D2PFC7_HYPSF|nr:hypothetical protein HYPSUDRAFT_35816 [Hypholoma sublateritium FD-334 SS-4]
MAPAPAGTELDFADDQREGSDTELPTPRAKSTAKSQPKSTKAKGKAVATPARKTKRKVVVSDSEDAEDDYMDTVLDVVAEADEDEDYYSLDEKPVKPSKGETKSSTTKVAGRGTKRKARVEPSDSGHASTEKKGSATSKKKAKLPPKVEEPVIDVVGDSAPESSINVDRSSPLTPIQDSPPVNIPKKQKLPTIKKNKLAVSSGVNTPQANPSGTKPPLELGLNNKLNHGEIRKTLINQTDIDLSNKSIYQEIFLKMTGDGATPRRTKEEERRKELNRLRDEAKAKRTEEAQHSFDLQAQYDKISRFEDKLRAERSSALWPNFMGAKWRDEYERERRRQKEQQNQETAYDNTREEGEVN